MRDALSADADRDSDRADRDPALAAELRFYRGLFGAVCDLRDCSERLDQVPCNPDDAATIAAWGAFWDAADEVFAFVRTEEHAAAMDAAGVTCNELHHAPLVRSA